MFNIKKFNEISNLIKKTKKTTEIVAISKNQPLESVQEAINHGVQRFGENRVQEAMGKFINIKKDNSRIELHLTGPIQSNKVKTAISLFDVFHTIDREKIAKEFAKYEEQAKTKKFFVQVNIGKEKTKSGVYPNEIKDFLFFLKKEIQIPISGLMCIPPIDENPKYHFNKLKTLAEENDIKELSMGMSADYKEAIEFNPTYIRLGTILFGKR